MQCHSTPDDAPRVCVGFAIRVGFRSVGLRFAAAVGAYSPDEIAPVDLETLHTLESVLSAHGGIPDDRECDGQRAEATPASTTTGEER